MTTAPSGRTGSGGPRNLQAAPGRRRAPMVAGAKHGKMDDPRNEFSNQEWYDMVATAAYYRAEARGFDGGSAEDDWYEAEAELRGRFSSAGSSVETASGSGGEAANIETTGE